MNTKRHWCQCTHHCMQNSLPTSCMNPQHYHQTSPPPILRLMTNGSLAAMIVNLLNSMSATTPNPALIRSRPAQTTTVMGAIKVGVGGLPDTTRELSPSPQSSIRVGHCVNLQPIHQSALHRWCTCTVYLILNLGLTGTTTAGKAN